MKKFVIKTIKFTLLPALMGLALLLGGIRLINKTILDFSIDQHVNTVFIGDSHIQKAVVDSIIPESLNLATSSEAPYYSYFKLKKLLESNPNIKRVCLGYSYHSISSYYDKFIRGTYTIYTAPKYMYLLPFKEQLKMIFRNTDKPFDFIRRTIKQTKYKIKRRDSAPYSGRYYNQFENTQAVKSSMDRRLKFQFYGRHGEYPISETGINYLEKIISLCETYGVELYILNTPLHDYYYNNIPSEYKHAYDELIRQKELNYLDFKDFELSDAYYIPDGDHLTQSGARKFTRALGDTLSHKYP